MPTVTAQPGTMAYSINNGQPTGSQLRRRYLPPGGVGGAAGPGTSALGAPKTPGGVGPNATIGGPPPASQSWNPKGGQVGFNPPGPPAGGGAPWTKPVMPGQGQGQAPGGAAHPFQNMRNMFGGFNPSQMTQQNGQWGGFNPQGVFQALGQSALGRWLAQQGGGQPPTTMSVNNGGQPTTMSVGGPQGYVNAEQFANQDYNWFRQGEQAAGRPTDFNAFNEWFRQFGRSFDPVRWNELYGGGPVMGG